MNRLSRVHERYRRQTTDGRAIAYSEREREFTFAKKSEPEITSSGNAEEKQTITGNGK